MLGIWLLPVQLIPSLHAVLAHEQVYCKHACDILIAGPKELFAKSDSVKVPTAIAPYDVVFKKTASGVTVTDFQGNVAKVLKADLGTGNTRVHVIDRVLYSGGCWDA